MKYAKDRQALNKQGVLIPHDRYKGNYQKGKDTGKGMMQMLGEPAEEESVEEESAEEDDYVNLSVDMDPVYLCIENGCENEVAQQGSSCGRCNIGGEGRAAMPGMTAGMSEQYQDSSGPPRQQTGGNYAAVENPEMYAAELQDRIFALEQQLHEAAEMKNHIESSAGMTPFCCYFSRQGSCKYGVRCRYVHEPPSRIWALVGRFPMRCDRMLRHGSCRHYDLNQHP